MDKDTKKKVKTEGTYDLVSEKSEVQKILEETQITLAGTDMGVWNILISNGVMELYMDETMAELIGTPRNTDGAEAYNILIKHVSEQDREALANYFTRMISGEKSEIEYTYNHPYKGEIFVRCGGVRDKNYLLGDGVLLRGYHQDITEQWVQKRRLEEAMMVNHALSQDYANVYIVNPEDKTIEVRKQNGFIVEQAPSGATLGMSYEAAWKKYVDSCVHPEDKEALFKAGQLETVIEKLKSQSDYTYNYRTVNMGERYFQFKYLRMEDGKIIAGYRNIDQDIRHEIEQRKIVEEALEAAENANNSKTIFLNSMSHDIRTPMNAIIGFTTLASSHLDDREKVKDYLGKIQTSSNHLLALINDVLDMSRIESGNVKIKEKAYSLTDIMHDIKNIIQADIRRKELNLVFDISEIQEDIIICDRLRLNQVLINCLSNAIKFTAEMGMVELSAKQIPSVEPSMATYEFHVKDSGIGMSEEFAEHIFEPFTRENTSTVSGIQGTGLGMSITKNIVDLMGGSISVKSIKDKGSDFTIIFSFQIVTDEATRETVKKAALYNSEVTVGIQSLEGVRILLAEDNELNREIAVEILSEHGAEVDTAEDGHIVLEKFEAAKPSRYDLILMDIQMPIMD